MWCACEGNVIMCVCITHKQIIAEISKFDIEQLYHKWMLLKTFYEDQTTNLCTGAHKSILIHYGLWTEFLVCALYN